MKRSLRLLAGLPLILTAACASLPGVSSVPLPDQAPPPPELPAPPVCLMGPETPTPQERPSLPVEAPAPALPQRDTVEWWRSFGLHYQSRALRAEAVQAFAANVADEERRVRQQNAEVQTNCAEQLRARE